MVASCRRMGPELYFPGNGQYPWVQGLERRNWPIRGNRAVMGCHPEMTVFIRLHFASSLVLAPLLVLEKQAPLLGTGCEGTHMVRICRSLEGGLQLQGTEVRQQPKWASKWILPQSNLKKRTQPRQHLGCSLVRPWSREPRTFHLQKLWDNKCMLF